MGTYHFPNIDPETALYSEPSDSVNQQVSYVVYSKNYWAYTMVLHMEPYMFFLVSTVFFLHYTVIYKNVNAIHPLAHTHSPNP